METLFEKILKSKFLLIFGLLVFIGVCIYFLLSIFSMKPQSLLSTENTGAETDTEERIFFQPLFQSEETVPSSSIAQSLDIPMLPIPKPDLMKLRKKEDTPSQKLLLFFENIRKAAQSAEEQIAKQVSAPTSSSPGVLSNGSVTATSTYEEITLSINKDEFNFLYPETFLKTLMDSQPLLKSYDPTFEALPTIETDSQVRLVQEKIVIALLSANMINKTEAERFITTIRYTLPQLQLIELNERKQARNFFSNLAIHIVNIFSRSNNSQGVFLAGLAERLENAFLPTVEAGGGGICGECHSLPFCAQEGISSPITPGPEFFKPFCQCSGCLFGQGCLDSCAGKAALYDPLTGICGCGI